MTVRAVVFDIGGVLEITPPTGWVQKWEAALGLAPGELDQRTHAIWRAGSIGTISETDVHRSVSRTLGLDDVQLTHFMDDLWTEYLGTLNVELAEYFQGLRPRYQTAILSNSFVGAREKEQDRYGFADMTDLIIYSHEVGTAKPDPRVFQLTCARLGVQPAETVFLDDVEVAVEAARTVGLQGILFVDNAQAIAAIESRLRGLG